MVTYVGILMAAWVAGYGLGWQVKMIRLALRAGT